MVTIDERTAVYLAGSSWHVFGDGRLTVRRGETKIALTHGTHDASATSLPV